MNLLVLESDQVENGLARLEGRQHRHLRDTLKVTEGQQLRAGIADGGLGLAQVLEHSRTHSLLRIEINEPASVPHQVELWVALPRPPMLRRVLQISACARVSHLRLTNAWRVEKSFFGSRSLDPAAIREQLMLGCEQGMSTYLPQVTVYNRFAELFELSVATPALVFDPSATQSMSSSLVPSSESSAVLAIGPEGGWIDRELASFDQAGFERVSLGQAIWRTEHAVVAALAQWEMARR